MNHSSSLTRKIQNRMGGEDECSNTKKNDYLNDCRYDPCAESEGPCEGNTTSDGSEDVRMVSQSCLTA